MARFAEIGYSMKYFQILYPLGKNLAILVCQNKFPLYYRQNSKDLNNT